MAAFNSDNSYQYFPTKTSLNETKFEYIFLSTGNSLTFSDKHLNGKGNVDVEGVKIIGREQQNGLKELNKLFKSLRRSFVNMTSLSMVKCKLTTLTKRNFIGLENLTSISFDENQLISLPEDLFSNMRKLEKISFDDNKISYLSSELFAGFDYKCLIYVSFRNNTRIDDCYDSFSKYCNKNPHEINIQNFISFLNIINIKCLNPRDNIMETSKLYKETFSQGFEQLLKTGRLSDFTIKVDSTEFKVHKNVLAIRSSVFHEYFKSKNTPNEMTIEGSDADTVRIFLDCFYTKQPFKGISCNAVENLYPLAIKFNVQMLKESCEESISRHINKSNAFDIYTLAHSCSSEDLKQEAFEEIVAMFPENSSAKYLIDKPELLKEMIAAKQQHDDSLVKAKLEYKNVLKSLEAQIPRDTSRDVIFGRSYRSYSDLTQNPWNKLN